MFINNPISSNISSIPILPPYTLPLLPTISSVFNPIVDFPNLTNSNVSIPIPITVTSPPYIDLNTDPNVYKDILQKIYYNKFLPNWSRYHYTDLYGFIKVINNKAEFVKDAKDLDKNNDENAIKIKHKFIVDMISPNKMLKIIDKFRSKNKINLWDIKDDTELILKDYIHYVIKHKILDKIGHNK
jgi:hypothetical protein